MGGERKLELRLWAVQKRKGLEGFGRGLECRTGGQGFQAPAGTRLRRAGFLSEGVRVGPPASAGAL